METLCKSLGGKCKPECADTEFAAHACSRSALCCVEKPALVEEVPTVVYDVERSSSFVWVGVGLLLGALSIWLMWSSGRKE